MRTATRPLDSFAGGRDTAAVRALALEHLRPDPIGVFGEVLMERGIGVDRVLLHEGDLVPDWRRYDLIVAMGAGASVWQEEEFPWIVSEKRTVREAVLAGLPYFGVCFGVQLLAEVFGARSFRGPEPEIGVNQVFLTAAARHDPVFRGFPRRPRGLRVALQPLLASAGRGPVGAFASLREPGDPLRPCGLRHPVPPRAIAR